MYICTLSLYHSIPACHQVSLVPRPPESKVIWDSKLVDFSLALTSFANHVIASLLHMPVIGSNRKICLSEAISTKKLFLWMFN